MSSISAPGDTERTFAEQYAEIKELERKVRVLEDFSMLMLKHAIKNDWLFYTAQEKWEERLKSK